MSRSTEVPNSVDLKLRLLVGGDLPYKWQVYEYPATGGPPIALPGGAGRGDERVAIAGLPPQQTRRFVWSVAAVNLNDEQEVDVRVQALATDIVVGELAATWKVGRTTSSCFVHLDLTARAS